MRIGAIVQARMGSTRLPGKVVMPLAGRPALALLLERLRCVTALQELIVATSDRPGDDEVARLCHALGVPCHRGPHEDVAARLLQAAERFELDALVRVNGDSPLLDPALVSHGIELFSRGGAELVTNVFPRSFPRGQSVEVIATIALRQWLPQMSQQDREHVTVALYRDPTQLSIHNFSARDDAAAADWSDVRLVLDTAEDARRIEQILQAMDRPHWEYGWRELVDLVQPGNPSVTSRPRAGGA